MSAPAVRLENVSPDVPQTAYDVDTGEQWTLNAYEVRSFPTAVAKLFLEQCQQCVMKWEDVVLPPEPGVPTVWVANNTGNPSLPVMIRKPVYNQEMKAQRYTELPNPLRAPQALKFRYARAITPGTLGGEVYNAANMLVRIPPFTRRPAPSHVASSWLQSDAMITSAIGGPALIVSRAPSDFEALEHWSLEDLIIYGSLLQPNFKATMGLKYPEEYPVVTSKEAAAEQEVEKDDARKIAWQQIYFFLINPKVSLPPRDLFLRRKDTYQAERSQKMRKPGPEKK